MPWRTLVFFRWKVYTLWSDPKKLADERKETQLAQIWILFKHDVPHHTWIWWITLFHCILTGMRVIYTDIITGFFLVYNNDICIPYSYYEMNHFLLVISVRARQANIFPRGFKQILNCICLLCTYDAVSFYFVNYANQFTFDNDGWIWSKVLRARLLFKVRGFGILRFERNFSFNTSILFRTSAILN